MAEAVIVHGAQCVPVYLSSPFLTMPNLRDDPVFWYDWVAADMRAHTRICPVLRGWKVCKSNKLSDVR